jgi:hypothetical protein
MILRLRPRQSSHFSMTFDLLSLELVGLLVLGLAAQARKEESDYM